MGWLELKIPPPLLLLILVLTMSATQSHFAGGLTSGAHIYAGLATMFAGFVIDFVALRSLIGNRTTPSPINIDRAKKLVATGLFSFTRNPMYLGMVLLLLGLVMLSLNLWQLIGPLVFVLYITRFQILPEERVMASKFGADYAAYRTRVRRWI